MNYGMLQKTPAAVRESWFIRRIRLPGRVRKLLSCNWRADLCAGVTRVMILRNECICSTSRDTLMRRQWRDIHVSITAAVMILCCCCCCCCSSVISAAAQNRCGIIKTRLEYAANSPEEVCTAAVAEEIDRMRKGCCKDAVR